MPEEGEQQAEGDEHHREDQEDDEGRVVNGRSRANTAASSTKAPTPLTQSVAASSTWWLSFTPLTRAFRMRRDHEPDHAERLHQDERRKRQADQLEDDGEAEQQRPDRPRTGGRAADPAGAKLRPASAWPAVASTLVTPWCCSCAPTDRKHGTDERDRDPELAGLN